MTDEEAAVLAALARIEEALARIESLLIRIGLGLGVRPHHG